MSKKIPDAVREYMSEIGKAKTPAKMAAVARNQAKGAAARRKDPLELPCICDGGDVLKADAHKTTCPRGRLLYQRERTAQQRAEKAAQSSAQKVVE